jgi:hypothetical protein
MKFSIVLPLVTLVGCIFAFTQMQNRDPGELSYMHHQLEKSDSEDLNSFDTSVFVAASKWKVVKDDGNGTYIVTDRKDQKLLKGYSASSFSLDRRLGLNQIQSTYDSTDGLNFDSASSNSINDGYTTFLLKRKEGQKFDLQDDSCQKIKTIESNDPSLSSYPNQASLDIVSIRQVKCPK